MQYFWKDHLLRTFGKRKYGFSCTGFVFINEECGNLKLAMMLESLLEILTKRRSQTFDVHAVTNVGEIISSITMYNIVNQLGKYYFSCGLVLNNLKDRKLFSDQINRNRFDLISARRAGIAPLCRI